jgi:hypothetical protein
MKCIGKVNKDSVEPRSRYKVCRNGEMMAPTGRSQNGSVKAEMKDNDKLEVMWKHEIYQRNMSPVTTGIYARRSRYVTDEQEGTHSVLVVWILDADSRPLVQVWQDIKLGAENSV